MALFGRRLVVQAGPTAAAAAAAARFEAEADGAKGSGDINLDNILKLIPGEVVPLFIAGSGIGGVNLSWVSWPLLVFLICFSICAVLRILASQPVGATGLRSVGWRLVMVSLAAFFLWAHAVSPVGGPVVSGLPAPAWGFLAMAFGIVAPKLVPAV